MKGVSRGTASPSPPQGEFTRLLETERRLAERVQQARMEADGIVAAAQAEAAQREAALAAEVAAAREALDQAFDTERQKRAAEIAAAAAREAAAFERIPAERVAAVARGLAEQVLTGTLDP
jgi:vacuolar-type H+-ATPase subunit H